jgi:hypothetical protein
VVVALRDRLASILLINGKADRKLGTVYQLTRLEWFFKRPQTHEGLECANLLRNLGKLPLMIEDDASVPQILADIIDQMDQACLNAVIASSIESIQTLRVCPYEDEGVELAAYFTETWTPHGYVQLPIFLYGIVNQVTLDLCKLSAIFKGKEQISHRAVPQVITECAITLVKALVSRMELLAQDESLPVSF